jgi:transcriptional regulator with XRE-family HTH domain
MQDVSSYPEAMADLSRVLADNVRAERARCRWSQQYLGEQMGWSQATVSDVEAGERQLTITDLLFLCRLFQLPLVKLLDGLSPEDLKTFGLV